MVLYTNSGDINSTNSGISNSGSSKMQQSVLVVIGKILKKKSITKRH